MVRAAIGAAGAGRLLERALTTTDVARTGPLRLIAAGKAAPAMAATAARLLGARVRAGVVIGAGRAPNGDAPPALEQFGRGHPVPTLGSERARTRTLAIAHALPA